MEYIEGESLSNKVGRYGCLSEVESIAYIRQIASALDFIHQRGINHLDVKPANIMIRKEDHNAILIDFGLSKQYDAQGGQTSTTPVGISHGYAPMEQYNVGGVSTFSPQTDIYSLGATLYKLVSGQTPPQAAEILNDGLPKLPIHLPKYVKNAITQAMQVRKKDRPINMKNFLVLLDPLENLQPDESSKVIQVQPKNIEDETTKLKPQEKPAVNEETITIGSNDERKKLLSLFELAEKGDPVSQLKLGDYYYSKKNNIDEAKKWWSKAAEQGNKDAKFNLDYYKHQPFRRWFLLAFIFIIVIPFLILAILG